MKLYNLTVLSILLLKKVWILKKNIDVQFFKDLSIAEFLSQRNLPFRDPNEKLYNYKNWNFLGLGEFISKFDPLLLEQLCHVSNDEVKHHYIENRIQNKFIQLISENILEAIWSSVKRSKYFSIILNCTLDIGHKQQTRTVLRSVNCFENNTKALERFIGFLAVPNSTSLSLRKFFLTKLSELGLSI